MLTQARLKEILDYSPKTGMFFWHERNDVRPQWNTRYAGRRAGCLNKISGYRQIIIDNKKYYEHRLAFMWIRGFFPKEVDHRNCQKDDNRWDNLRECTHSQNQANCGARSHNRCGIKGIRFDYEREMWCAQVTFHGKTINLGRFHTQQEAIDTFRQAICDMHGPFARVA